MKIGFMAPYDQERIAFARENGFGSIELMVGPDAPYFPGNDGWKSRAEEVRQAFADAGLEVGCLAAFYVNHMDPPQEEAHRDRVRNAIRLAEAMGVPVVAGFSGRIVDEPLEASLAPYKRIWGAHARFAEDHGVKIAFEHCPMGQFNTPCGGINCMCTPDFWRKAFDAVPSEALGLEWDPSHLVCLFIDPVANLREFGQRVHHVHAKDAKVNRDIVARNGFWSPGAVEHCFPGLGDTDWGQVIKELYRQGYDNNLDIEGWHDAVYRDRRGGPRREDAGLRMSLRHLSQFVA